MIEKYIFAAILFFLFIGDFYAIVQAGKQFLGWTEVVMVILLVFGLLGEKIVKLSVGKEGFSIEQKIRDISQEVGQIQWLEEYGDESSLKNFLDQIEKIEDIGYRLLLYRLMLRLSLRKVCMKFGMDPPAKNREYSIWEMLEFLAKKNMSKLLIMKIELIRDSTYFLEWGLQGKSMPNPETLKAVLLIAPEVLKSLQKEAILLQKPNEPIA